jgi:hypothetical protein
LAEEKTVNQEIAALKERLAEREAYLEALPEYDMEEVDQGVAGEPSAFEVLTGNLK